MALGKKVGGVREAAKMLSGMDKASQERILLDIAKQDPQMAEAIRMNMVVFDDLVHLSGKMMAELLQEVSIDDFALALRMGSKELVAHVLSCVSSRVAKDIQGVVAGAPKPASEVQNAHERIMVVVRQKVEKGELILKPDDEDEYV